MSRPHPDPRQPRGWRWPSGASRRSRTRRDTGFGAGVVTDGEVPLQVKRVGGRPQDVEAIAELEAMREEQHGSP